MNNRNELKRVLQQKEGSINKAGHCVLNTRVEHGNYEIPLAYSVGLSYAGLPELLVFRLPPDVG